MLPQVGQGALAVECRRRRRAVRRAAGRPSSTRPAGGRWTPSAASWPSSGGDCDLPAGAHATVSGDQLRVEGLIASLDGHVVLRHHVEGPASGDSAELGRSVARFLLVDAGGASLLAG